MEKLNILLLQIKKRRYNNTIHILLSLAIICIKHVILDIMKMDLSSLFFYSFRAVCLQYI